MGKLHETDIAIVGGGLAGSMTAAMLAKSGQDAVLIEPKPECGQEFRCEKLDQDQIALLDKTGLAEPVFNALTRVNENWIARFGRLVEKRQVRQYGFHYDTMVNAVRGQIPGTMCHFLNKAVEIIPAGDRQKVMLCNGEAVSARLVVLSCGLDFSLKEKLGIEREIRQADHIMCIGFDLLPAAGNKFKFSAFTYWPESTRNRMTHLALFKAGPVYRANTFGYWDRNDLLLRRMRKEPQAVIHELMPGVKKIIGDFEPVGRVHVRPVDLYVARKFLKPGIVLVGDAFSTSCPGAGTGAYKVFTDVERLCNVHIPNWMQKDAVDADSISEFYNDPVRQASEQYSLDRAMFLKSISLKNSLPWKMRRWARFLVPVVTGALKLDIDWEKFTAGRKRSPQES